MESLDTKVEYMAPAPAVEYVVRRRERLMNWIAEGQQSFIRASLCESSESVSTLKTIPHPKNANERKRALMQESKRAQKSAKGRKRALLRDNCKQPGLQQPG